MILYGRFLNSNLEGNGITNEADVNALVKSVKFSGQTMLGTCLKKKILDPFTSDGMNKPILVITITDGDPAGMLSMMVMIIMMMIMILMMLNNNDDECVDLVMYQVRCVFGCHHFFIYSHVTV